VPGQQLALLICPRFTEASRTKGQGDAFLKLSLNDLHERDDEQEMKDDFEIDGL